MYRVVVLALAVSALFGQDTASERLKREAARVKAYRQEKGATDEHPALVASLHQALRDWIESRLPADKASMPDSFCGLESALQWELKDSGLAEEDPGPLADDDAYPLYAAFGSVSLQFHQLPELPDILLVTAGTSIPCGDDAAVYGYLFGTTRTRVIEDYPVGFHRPKLELSAPDAEGRQVLLMHSRSVQCQSTWMGMTYSAYRFGMLPDIPQKLLSVHHGFWLGNDGPEFHLEPDGLAVEYLDASLDAGVHNRTQVYRYAFADEARRIDPIAFQPQDFVEEWLTRPWEEVQSRSLPETKEAHGRLHADHLFAEYSNVVPCLNRPGRWLIALDITNIGERELPEPISALFLVHELGQYRYQMESVSDTEPKGCSGDGDASDRHPWLSPSEIWKLPR
jgi:hypothetical protein